MKNAAPISLESFQYLANDGTLPLRPIDEGDEALLFELREILLSNSMEDRFGISLINQNFFLGESEVTMEVSDHYDRLSLIRVMEEESVENATILPTNWHFRKDGKTRALRCLGYCKYANYRHSDIHRGIRGLSEEKPESQIILSV